MGHEHPNLRAAPLILIAFGFPAFLFNIGNLLYKSGWKKTWELSKRYPQTVISPIFTAFLFTYTESLNGNEQNSNNGNNDEMEKSLSTDNNRNHTECCFACPKNISDAEPKSGFHIWQCPSFLNYVYMLLIPAIIPIYSQYGGYFPITSTVKLELPVGFSYHANLILYYPVFTIMLIIGGLYFWGCCTKFVGPFAPDVLEPRFSNNIVSKN